MHVAKPFALLLVNLAVASSSALSDATGCGDAQACIGTETCITVTRTAPTKTTITTCAPTPTCLRIYQGCTSGGGTEFCCSGYCAATKCRPTDPKWPNCQEDMGYCECDSECCYNNKCVDNFCRKP
ncbi:alpha-crystallin domain-containing protein [Histoplasma capsulatum]|uniref:Alpha-crystallin domain-containing protein n=1 Tax=Ajellomyces capsulatus TaxID=5037 RepID=A0A8A1M439_AJECA|nr:alpha-crystallin domain-containing protein [Histoplasma capsulatum]